MIWEVKAKPDDEGIVTVICPKCNCDRNEPVTKFGHEYKCCNEKCNTVFRIVYDAED